MISIGAAVGAGVLVTAFRDIPNADGTVSACIAKTAHTAGNGGGSVLDRKGTLRAIDVAAGETCQADEQLLTFNVQGPQGAPGAPGTPGAPGAPGEPGKDAITYWATVNADGSIFASNTIIEPLGTEHNNPGLYMINFGFDKNLSGCVAVAQTTRFNVPEGGVPIVPFATGVGRPSQYQFNVSMWSIQAAAHADHEFTIMVHC